jgi:hypothetical protein
MGILKYRIINQNIIPQEIQLSGHIGEQSSNYTVSPTQETVTMTYLEQLDG